jgi:hypothetical protein
VSSGVWVAPVTLSLGRAHSGLNFNQSVDVPSGVWVAPVTLSQCKCALGEFYFPKPCGTGRSMIY